jgi:hypothetical protein
VVQLGFGEKLAQATNLKTVFTVSISSLMAVMVFAVQNDEFNRAILCIPIFLTIFTCWVVTYVLHNAGSIAEWMRSKFGGKNNGEKEQGKGTKEGETTS